VIKEKIKDQNNGVFVVLVLELRLLPEKVIPKVTYYVLKQL
jgi:hypothetical protein